jgi:hypothetical protein
VRKSAMKNGDGAVDPVHSKQGWAGIRVETSTRHQVRKSAMKNGDGAVDAVQHCPTFFCGAGVVMKLFFSEDEK